MMLDGFRYLQFHVSVACFNAFHGIDLLVSHGLGTAIYIDILLDVTDCWISRRYSILVGVTTARLLLDTVSQSKNTP